MESVLVGLSVLKTEVRYPSLFRVLFKVTSFSPLHVLQVRYITVETGSAANSATSLFTSQLGHIIDGTMAAVLTAAQQQQLQQLQNDFQEYQKYLQDRFSRYRSGDVSAGDSLDQIKADFNRGLTARLNGIRARQIPRVRYAAQLRLYKQGILGGQAARRRNSYGGNGPGGVEIMSALNKRIAKSEFQSATEMMTAKKAFHFIKILGAGGNG